MHRFGLVTTFAIAAVFLTASGTALGQASKGGQAGDSFVLTGTVADSKGPLSKNVVIISPIDAKDGKPRNVFVPAGGRMESVNPRTESGAKGEFSVTVPRSLFRPPAGCASGCPSYRKGELSLGVFTAMGSGKMGSSLESAVIKFDEKAAATDAGRIVLQPLK